MNFFEKISLLLVAALAINNEPRKQLIQNLLTSSGNLQRAALRFDEASGVEGSYLTVGEGLIGLAELFSAPFPDLTDAQKAQLKTTVDKLVQLPTGADEVANDLFSALVETLDAAKELSIDENQLPTA